MARKPGYADDKANIESGHAKAARERFVVLVLFCMISSYAVYNHQSNCMLLPSDEEHVGVESLISIVHDLQSMHAKSGGDDE